MPCVGKAFTPRHSSLADIAASLGQRPPRGLTRMCFGLGLLSFQPSTVVFGRHAACVEGGNFELIGSFVLERMS